MDDQVPAGAVPQGTWNWDTTQKASGTQSHTQPAVSGWHQHLFTGASQTMSPAAGENLVCYVLINPCNPPLEIMLEWYENGSWEHRAYWGANLITSGTNGTASRYPVGALPQAGRWVRLEVPASSVGLANKVISGMAFTLFGGQAWFDRAGKGGTECQVSVASPPSLPLDTVWVEDQVPAGAVLGGTWNWDTTQKASGTQSNTDPAAAGFHEHYFFNASQTLYVAPGDKLVCYVLINPCNPPQEIMLQWYDSSNSWHHRAYWGQNLVESGTNGTTSRYPMGPLPQSGEWVRLEVPATSVGLAGKVIKGMAFTLYGGQAWFDRAGKGGCPVSMSPPPSSFPPDTVWVDDQAPAGAVMQGIWNWDTAQKASGTQSHTEPSASGTHQHSFTGASQTLYVASGDQLVCYVLLNPCDSPQEIMLQWYENGSWEHRAYWGANLIAWGTYGTSSRYPMGSLPQSGAWVRLEVPSSVVGLGGKTVTGMAFTLYGGQAWFDWAGKNVCQPPWVAITPPAVPNETLWVDDQVPTGAAVQGTWNWDTTQKASGAQSHTEPSASATHQHYFTGASQTLNVAVGDKLICYVLINTCDPPQEIMLQWYENGSWEHRAYWGANLVTWGTNGTSSRYPMGSLPQAGSWIKLEVPAALVGLEGKTVTGMAYTLYGGQAWFDRAGKSP